MTQGDTPPEEKPRYLLPNGCKDLVDALRLERKSELPAPTHDAPEPSSSSTTQPLPASITIPDPVIVRDLAAALHMKPHEIIRELMHYNIFATQHAEIEFAKAFSICSDLGVVAHPVI
jgi:hypothetical protein